MYAFFIHQNDYIFLTQFLLSEHNPVGKIAEKAVKRTPSDCFFRDFAHWEKHQLYTLEIK